MGNCLLTTLNASVNNDALPYFDTFKFTLKAKSNATSFSNNIKTFNNDVIKLSMKGDGYFTNSSGTENLGKSITYTMPTTECLKDVYYKSTEPVDIYINHKYSLTRLNITPSILASIDISQFKDCVNLTYIAAMDCGASGNLSDIANLQLTYLAVNGGSISGTVSDFYPFKDITALGISSCSNIYGEIGTILGRLIDNGRTTSSTLIIYPNGSSNLTYNGNPITYTGSSSFIFTKVSDTEYTATHSSDATLNDTWIKSNGVWSKQ